MKRELRSLLREVVSTMRKERYPILLLFLFAIILSLVAGGLSIIPGNGENIIGYLRDTIQSLVPELIGAIIIFLLLDRVLQSLPLAKLREHDKLPIEAYIDIIEKNNANRNPYSEKFRILESFTRLVNSPDYRIRFEKAIRQALNEYGDRELEFQILLVHPYSHPARVRASELNPSEVQDNLVEWNSEENTNEKIIPTATLASRQPIPVEDEIQTTLRALYAIRLQLSEANRERFQVKLHSTPLRIALYMWDQGTFFSHFSSNNRSDEVPCLEATAESEIHRSLLDWFNDVWKDQNNTLSLNNHMTLGALALMPTDRLEGREDGKPDLYFAGNEADLSKEDTWLYAMLPERPLLREKIENDKKLVFCHDFRCYRAKALIVTDNEEQEAAYEMINEKYSSESIGMRLLPYIIKLTELEIEHDDNPRFLD